MPKTTTPLRLAKSYSQWNEIDQVVNECVDAICGTEDAGVIRSFLTLVSLMSDRRYKESDRLSVAQTAENRAFRHTRECDAAQRVYMDKLVLPTEGQITA